MRIDPISHRGAPKRQLCQPRLDRAQSRNPMPHLCRIPAKLLPQGHWGRILQMSSADFQYPAKLLSFLPQRLFQPLQSWAETVLNAIQGGYVYGSRNYIIARLASVYVVIRMHKL